MMKYDDNHKAATVREKIRNWYISRDMSLPQVETLDIMVSETIRDIVEIPELLMGECWDTRQRESTFCPRGCDLVKAWREDVSKRPVNASGSLGPPESHECIYCVVSAIRLGTPAPYVSLWERYSATLPPTKREIDCVRNRLQKQSMEFKFWNENVKSPYRGML